MIHFPGQRQLPHPQRHAPRHHRQAPERDLRGVHQRGIGHAIQRADRARHPHIARPRPRALRVLHKAHRAGPVALSAPVEKRWIGAASQKLPQLARTLHRKSGRRHGYLARARGRIHGGLYRHCFAFGKADLGGRHFPAMIVQQHIGRLEFHWRQVRNRHRSLRDRQLSAGSVAGRVSQHATERAFHRSLRGQANAELPRQRAHRGQRRSIDAEQRPPTGLQKQIERPHTQRDRGRRAVGIARAQP